MSLSQKYTLTHWVAIYTFKHCSFFLCIMCLNIFLIPYPVPGITYKMFGGMLFSNQTCINTGIFPQEQWSFLFGVVTTTAYHSSLLCGTPLVTSTAGQSISSVLLCNWWGMFLKFICLCSVCIGYSKTVICVGCPCGTVDAVLLRNFWLSVNVDKAGVTFSVPFFKDQTYAFLENCYLQPITGKIHRFLGNVVMLFWLPLSLTYISFPFTPPGTKSSIKMLLSLFVLLAIG